MIPGWISDAADKFWAAAGDPPEFPRDLTFPALKAFVVDEQVMLGLRINAIQDWFAQRGCEIQFREHDRRLRGCLTAVGGSAIIFIDGADSTAEHRFTFAHEIAHFLVDYHLPRQRAIGLLGPNIVEVLDGLRAPTNAERIHSAISDCPLGLHYHLLDRRDLSGHIATVESRADQLAWELLAPDDELERSYGNTTFASAELCKELIHEFGFPTPEAARYAEHWMRARFGKKPLIRLV